MLFELKNTIGFRWLVLTPDNNELEKFYVESFKFIKYKAQKEKITPIQKITAIST